MLHRASLPTSQTSDMHILQAYAFDQLADGAMSAFGKPLVEMGVAEAEEDVIMPVCSATLQALGGCVDSFTGMLMDHEGVTEQGRRQTSMVSVCDGRTGVG